MPVSMVWTSTKTYPMEPCKIIAEEEFHLKGRPLGISVSMKANGLPPLIAGPTIREEWMYREIEYNGRIYKVVGIETFALAQGCKMDGCGFLIKPIDGSTDNRTRSNENAVLGQSPSEGV